MKFTEYRQYDATGLAGLVKSGEVQASELLDIAIARAAEVNPKINALHTPFHDFARKQSNKINKHQPFTGVPFLLKDLQHALKGVSLGKGSMASLDAMSTYNASLVDRCLAAGLLPFAKTTTPEFGLLAVTETKAHGATRNPWNLERTPGGSSGGSAAAIAAGIVPMASANDGGGSIRIPASHCGLFGLKPSRARVPTGPHYSEVWMGASADHVLTRSVRDSARMLDALQGKDIGAPFEIKPPATPYTEVIKQPSQKLSIAYTTESPIGTHVDQACIDAVHHTLQLLESMGHTVEEARPNYDGMVLAQDYLMLYFANVAAVVRDICQHYGRHRVKDLEAITRTLATVGESISSGEFYRSQQNWNTYSRCMGTFYERYDVFVTPVAAMPPIKIGESAPNPLELFALTVSNHMGLGKLLRRSGLIEKMARDNLKLTPFSQLANLTGLPAMSVPLYWSHDELPIGVQFIGPVGAEDRLLQLAAQLEEANPWFDKVAEI